ncbi:MAG: hypothetical protein LQ337_007264 [Flavoplaca oasis]|nr:MAG: hypothetical protein LQ337_007264 [Flavoplaca oasis]
MSPSLFALPLEIRRLVYRDYLHDLFPCRDQSGYENIIIDKIDQIPLLQVNSVVHAEVQETLVNLMKGLDVELSWQGLRINPLAVYTMRALSKGTKRHMSALSYLRFKIFAPHPRRPTDIICLWYHAKALCDQLQGYLVIPRLIIAFEEPLDSSHLAASCSKDGEEGLPRRSIVHQSGSGQCAHTRNCFCRHATYKEDNREAVCDLRYLLDVFSFLTNASTVEINLPPSLAANDRLRYMVQHRIDIMMKRKEPLHDHRLYVLDMSLFLEGSLAAPLCQTGVNSFLELVRLTHINPMTDARHFQEIWPHACCLMMLQADLQMQLDLLQSLSISSAHWDQTLTMLTPCNWCGHALSEIPSVRHFKYEICSPPWRGKELETLGGRHRRFTRDAGYWQFDSLFVKELTLLTYE